ncbi:halimadienyl-diphosphate synthase [Streptomyces sp. V4I8]|uniref:prenyltransferase/squalene oxidase repeat-containing protein n=1 Tax=Streptomyces sp. V4I8 TaxID=3156469 RepID=UPI003515A5B2
MYETGRVVSLLPDFIGHTERVDFLLTTQRPQGYWGPAHAGYALVPTLSATEALLTVQQRQPRESRTAAAVRRALCGLADLAEADVPDLPAADLVVSVLVPRIEHQLSHKSLTGDRPEHLPGWLRELAHRSEGRLAALRSMLSSPAPLEPKLLHAAETFGESSWLDKAHLSAEGSIGASPAASAAWLAAADGSGRRDSQAVRRYLERAVQQHGGALPCVWPTPVFERAWVLNWLLHSGITIVVPHHLRRSLHASLQSEGAATAAGLPADADTTSMVLASLTLLGERPDFSPLLRYELDTHFCTWPGEQGQSVTTNAHVLEALSLHVLAHPAEKRRYAQAIQKVSHWLYSQQRDWGGWEDRWHASPYYATFCAALALHRFDGARSAPALTATVQWLLETQHPDGSWGVWGGTVEETAYGVHLLVNLPASDTQSRAKEAVRLGRAHLARTATPQYSHPPLWHDKDLYAPEVIINAAVLTASLENQ